MKFLRFLLPFIFIGTLAMSCTDENISPHDGGDEDDDPIVVGGGH